MLGLVGQLRSTLIAVMMEHVFGPIISRRLGRSLGVDPVPQKTCNWNCVYCQLGRSMPVTNERAEYFAAEEIVAQVEEAVKKKGVENIDWVTITGSGEPTLHSGLGRIIQKAKEVTGLPVAVLTNGALLYLPEVRQALAAADAVLPNLDAGSEELFRRINRPHPDITFDRLLEGLITFRREYSGKLWIEVVLVKGLNDTEEALRDLAATLGRIRPDGIHLNLPTRPPSEEWVEPSDEEGQLRARAILGDVVPVMHAVEGTFDLAGYDDVVEAVIGIVTRHPMRQEELERTLEEWWPGEVEQALEELEASGRAQVVERYGVKFWSGAGAYYPDESCGRAPESKQAD